MEMVLSHLMGDLNVTRPSSVYSSGSSADATGFVVAFSDSFVICCTLLLLSLYTCRFTVTVLLLSPILLLSGCVASSTVTACIWFIMLASWTRSLALNSKSCVSASAEKLWSYESVIKLQNPPKIKHNGGREKVFLFLLFFFREKKVFFLALLLFVQSEFPPDNTTQSNSLRWCFKNCNVIIRRDNMKLILFPSAWWNAFQKKNYTRPISIFGHITMTLNGQLCHEMFRRDFWRAEKWKTKLSGRRKGNISSFPKKRETTPFVCLPYKDWGYGGWQVSGLHIIWVTIVVQKRKRRIHQGDKMLSQWTQNWI